MWLASKGVLYVGPAYLPRTKLEDERICSRCLPTSLPLLDRDHRLPKHQTPLPVSVDILRAKLMLGASGVMAEKEALAQAPSPRDACFTGNPRVRNAQKAAGQEVWIPVSVRLPQAVTFSCASVPLSIKWEDNGEIHSKMNLQQDLTTHPSSN